MLSNDPNLPPKPQFSIAGLMFLTCWVALLLTFPNWWWRFLCIVEVVSFILFVEFIIMNFPRKIQSMMERNTIRLDESISDNRLKIENAVIGNFKLNFMFQAGCILAAVNLMGLLYWISIPFWQRQQRNFVQYSDLPDAGEGVIFHFEFQLAVVTLASLFTIFVVGGFVYFRLLRRLQEGILFRSRRYMEYDINSREKSA